MRLWVGGWSDGRFLCENYWMNMRMIPVPQLGKIMGGEKPPDLGQWKAIQQNFKKLQEETTRLKRAVQERGTTTVPATAKAQKKRGGGTRVKREFPAVRRGGGSSRSLAGAGSSSKNVTSTTNPLSK